MSKNENLEYLMVILPRIDINAIVRGLVLIGNWNILKGMDMEVSNAMSKIVCKVHPYTGFIPNT